MEDIYFLFTDKDSSRTPSALENGLEPFANIISSMRYTKEECEQIAIQFLNENNKGVTVLKGNGMKEKNYIINTVIQRKDGKEIIKKIEEITNGRAFIISSDVSRSIGGYGLQK